VVAFGRIWLTPCNDSAQTVSVDTTTNEVVNYVGFIPQVALSSDALAGGDAVASRPPAIRLNPQTLLPDVFLKGSVPEYDFILFTADSAWGISGVDDKLDRLDPMTGTVAESLVVPGFDKDEALYPAVLDGAIWLKGLLRSRSVRGSVIDARASGDALPELDSSPLVEEAHRQGDPSPMLDGARR
jgi:hypothetical protein